MKIPRGKISIALKFDDPELKQTIYSENWNTQPRTTRAERLLQLASLGFQLFNKDSSQPTNEEQVQQLFLSCNTRRFLFEGSWGRI